MVDAQDGPQLVECNSIAAGMAPFGEQIHMLHRYLAQRWPAHLARQHIAGSGVPLANPATANLASAICAAARQVARELGCGDDRPGFLMIVQDNEDNLFDQRLLERQLQSQGLRTYRRTFRQLHEQLSTGPNQSLTLEGCGTIHVVYLRAGYQYSDYVATDLDTRRCCDAISGTRIFIERHRVAVNATVAQQLATSKRMQQHLGVAGAALLQQLGFEQSQRELISAVLAPMRAIDGDSLARLLTEAGSDDWVLKNQGEGGGHCLFGGDIRRRLEEMRPQEYPSWVLMRRLRPHRRVQPTLIVRDARVTAVEQLECEIGLFTAHLAGDALTSGDHPPGYIGYLVRSKPAEVTEGGVHSGSGALDSLLLQS